VDPSTLPLFNSIAFTSHHLAKAPSSTSLKPLFNGFTSFKGLTPLKPSIRKEKAGEREYI